MTWQKVRIALPSEAKPKERKAIAKDVIDFIKQRAKAGIGFNPNTNRNKNFVGYTKAYSKKKGQTNVDLTLSNKMLSAIKLLSDKNGSILVGFANSTTNNAKAEGNQTGSYGRSPRASKARPFLGITPRDLDDIVSSILPEPEDGNI